MASCFGACWGGGFNRQQERKRFLEAARQGDDHATAASLAQRPDLVLSTTLIQRKTALHLAAEKGHDAVMASILETLLCQASHATDGKVKAEGAPAPGLLQLDPESQVASLINARDADGRTPLIIACGHNHVECARLLLSNGAWREPADLRGNSALHYASAKGYLGIMLMLLTEFQEELKAEQLEYLRHHAQHGGGGVAAAGPGSALSSSAGSLAAAAAAAGVEHLVAGSLAASLGGGAAGWGAGPLDAAALARAEAALPDARRLADMRNGAGFAPLHYAVWSKQSGAVQVLLQHGADLLARNVRAGIETSIPCPSACTPLHLAAMRGHIEISRILLKTHYERVLEPLQLAMAVTGGNAQALQRALAEVDPRTQTNGLGLMPYKVAHRTGYLSLASLLRPQIPLARLFNEEEHRLRFYGPPALKLLAAEALNRKLLGALDQAMELAAQMQDLTSEVPLTPTAAAAPLPRRSPTPPSTGAAPTSSSAAAATPGDVIVGVGAQSLSRDPSCPQALGGGVLLQLATVREDDDESAAGASGALSLLRIASSGHAGNAAAPPPPPPLPAATQPAADAIAAPPPQLQVAAAGKPPLMHTLSPTSVLTSFSSAASATTTTGPSATSSSQGVHSSSGHAPVAATTTSNSTSASAFASDAFLPAAPAVGQPPASAFPLQASAGQGGPGGSGALVHSSSSSSLFKKTSSVSPFAAVSLDPDGGIPGPAAADAPPPPTTTPNRPPTDAPTDTLSRSAAASGNAASPFLAQPPPSPPPAAAALQPASASPPPRGAPSHTAPQLSLNAADMQAIAAAAAAADTGLTFIRHAERSSAHNGASLPLPALPPQPHHAHSRSAHQHPAYHHHQHHQALGSSPRDVPSSSPTRTRGGAGGLAPAYSTGSALPLHHHAGYGHHHHYAPHHGRSLSGRVHVTLDGSTLHGGVGQPTTMTSLSPGVVALQRGGSVTLVGAAAASAQLPLGPISGLDHLSGVVEDTAVPMPPQPPHPHGGGTYTAALEGGSARRGRMAACLPRGSKGGQPHDVVGAHDLDGGLGLGMGLVAAQPQGSAPAGAGWRGGALAGAPNSPRLRAGAPGLSAQTSMELADVTLSPSPLPLHPASRNSTHAGAAQATAGAATPPTHSNNNSVHGGSAALGVLRSVRRSLSGLRTSLSGQLALPAVAGSPPPHPSHHYAHAHTNGNGLGGAHTAAANGDGSVASGGVAAAHLALVAGHVDDAALLVTGDVSGRHAGGYGHGHSNNPSVHRGGVARMGSVVPSEADEATAAQDEEEEEEEECGVCLEHPALVLVQPCGHSICGPCAQKMCTVNAQRTPHCPFCRGLLEDFCANEPVLRRRRARAVLQQQQQRQA